jgi:hypothetical protein
MKQKVRVIDVENPTVVHELTLDNNNNCRKKPCETCDERNLFPCDGARIMAKPQKEV